MIWLSRPPYGRYAAAAAILLIAMWMDLRPGSQVLHPFAARDIAAGAVIDDSDVEWREVPSGLLPTVEVGGLAATDLAAGAPILPDLVVGTPAIPEGWFALELDIPSHATPGQGVRLVVEADWWTDGIVVALSADENSFLGSRRSALVAVPADGAGRVADAARTGVVTVLLGG